MSNMKVNATIITGSFGTCAKEPLLSSFYCLYFSPPLICVESKMIPPLT